MVAINGKSVQKGIRIPKEHYAYLVKKATRNPENRHNNISTEINLLIEADFHKNQVTARTR